MRDKFSAAGIFKKTSGRNLKDNLHTSKNGFHTFTPSKTRIDTQKSILFLRTI